MLRARRATDARRLLLRMLVGGLGQLLGLSCDSSRTGVHLRVFVLALLVVVARFPVVMGGCLVL